MCPSFILLDTARVIFVRLGEKPRRAPRGGGEHIVPVHVGLVCRHEVGDRLSAEDGQREKGEHEHFLAEGT